MRALASFGWDYFKHIGSEIHQELHSPLGPAYMIKQLFITGGQAVPQPVFDLQNGRQVSQLGVQELHGELGDAPVVHPEVPRQLRQEAQFVFLAETAVEVHELQAVWFGRRRGFVSGFVRG